MMLLLMMMLSLHALLRFMKARNQPLIGQKQRPPQFLCTWRDPFFQDMSELKGSPLRHVFGWNRDLLVEYNPMSWKFMCFPNIGGTTSNHWNPTFFVLKIRVTPFILVANWTDFSIDFRPTSNVAILSPMWLMMPRRREPQGSETKRNSRVQSFRACGRFWLYMGFWKSF